MKTWFLFCAGMLGCSASGDGYNASKDVVLSDDMCDEGYTPQMIPDCGYHLLNADACFTCSRKQVAGETK